MSTVYMAQCGETDPDSNDYRAAVLGIFTTRGLARGAFTRAEQRHGEVGGDWTAEHICYRGAHEVFAVELDEWHPLGASMNGEVVVA